MCESVNIGCARENDILITAANGLSRLVGKHTIISGLPEESAVHAGFMLLATTKEPYFVNASMGSGTSGFLIYSWQAVMVR